MKKILTFLWALTMLCGVQAQSLHPKREFRGAWIQAVNGQFRGMSAQQMQQTLISQLNSLQEGGINAIIFQVRPSADALYPSEIEPWSSYLTGVQGQAPNPYWDPMQFMIDECHKRGMEFHAWINPYRASTSANMTLAPTHIYHKHPDWFLPYAGQLYFNPALQECRDYINKVVADIVTRYDIDAIHMDDYFYPYPVEGREFPDETYYQQERHYIGDEVGVYLDNFTNKGDWRRDKVNMLINQVHRTIKSLKPWVKFGISPFGIYRNQKSDPDGSATNGLQNYDDLYADVLLWARKGWIDYLIPQIYWQKGHPAADYDTLVQWWASHTEGRPVYIGQSIPNTVQYTTATNNELAHKVAVQRAFPTIGGSCQWYASAFVENQGGVRDAYVNDYHRYPAIVPTASYIDKKAPGKPSKVKPIWTEDGYVLLWFEPKAKTEMDVAKQYVIYRFAKGERVDLEDPSHIVSITSNTMYRLPYQDGKQSYTYIVTALDRLHNESKGVKKKIKL